MSDHEANAGTTRRDAIGTLLGASALALLPARAAAAGKRIVTVTPAKLERAHAANGAPTWVPIGEYQTKVADFDYVAEEWLASGVDDTGRPYQTLVYVRRPRDPAKFSGTTIVEPLHASAISPVYMYTSPYILRTGHAWVCVVSQKISLDVRIKPLSPARYGALHIETDPAVEARKAEILKQPVKVPEGSQQGQELESPEFITNYWRVMNDFNQASNAILAQVGAALRGRQGPLAGFRPGKILLVGHSQTGFMTTQYITRAHETHRRAGGKPVYDGYMPCGMPAGPFAPRDVPLIQVISEGDVPAPMISVLPEFAGMKYRRPDSDAPGDRYRLYELAGVSHMGTRYPPHSDPRMWQAQRTAGAIGVNVKMNSLPHHELFAKALDHLVQWVAIGTVPPQAARLQLGQDGLLERDAFGNTKGGVRCVQMDVPHSVYFASPRKADGAPAFGTVGTEQPFTAAHMAEIYGTPEAYREKFSARLDQLVQQGWMLLADTAKMRAEAQAQSW